MTIGNDTASRMAGEARQLAVQTADRVRDHALPSAAIAALVAGGVGYLLALNARSSRSSPAATGSMAFVDRTPEPVASHTQAGNGRWTIRGYAEQAGSRARHLSEQARTRAHDLSVDTRDRLRHAGTAADRWAHDHPLAVGAAAAALGLAVGLAAPRTRIEDELMGDASDALIGRGNRAGQAGPV